MKESAEVMRYSCPDYRPSFRENKPKALVMSHEKQAFWVGFRENWVFKFGQRTLNLWKIYGLEVGKHQTFQPLTHIGDNDR